MSETIVPAHALPSVARASPWRDPVALAAGALLAVLVGREIAEMVEVWNSIPESSHGFLVVPGFFYLLWRKRGEFGAAAVRPFRPAAALAVAALLLFLIGKQSGLPSLYRPAAVGLVWSYALWFFGPAVWRHLAWAFLLLLFLVPPPRFFLASVSVPLRGFATDVSCAIAAACGIPLSYAGTTIVLPAGTLEIEAACSGLRGVITLVLIAIFVGELKSARTPARLVLFAVGAALAIVLNVVRVLLTIVFVQIFGLAAATSAFHEGMGLAIVAAGAVVLVGLPIGRPRPREAQT